ncbi:nucleotidyltransferase family protein [Enterovirga aerilata]|uniref:nucleotidyltransferase family protein n=1 Tax=Enterovirga aerilata TaxID=2730920 RepID=UPI001AED4499
MSIATLIPRAADIPELRTLVARIEETYSPEAVLLFGSRAKGTARPDSDWDCLVLLPDGADEALLDPALGFDTARGSGVYADVLCAFSREFLRDVAVANTLAREIVGYAVRIGR